MVRLQGKPERIVFAFYALVPGDSASVYSGNERETVGYSRDGSVSQRYVTILDDKGNEVEKTDFGPQDGSVRNKYSYAYEFDAKGNWTKRVTSKWVTKDGKSSFVPGYVTYRTITYY